MNTTLDTLLDIAENLGWIINEKDDELTLHIFSDAGQDFNIILNDHNNEELRKEPKLLVEDLKKYIEGYNPVEEALLWIGPDGKGRNGAPENLEDIIADMKQCKEMMLTLLNLWQEKLQLKPENKQFTVYRDIRIDGEYDPSRHSDIEEVIETVMTEVMHRLNAHNHTVVDGISITDVTDCGEAI